ADHVELELAADGGRKLEQVDRPRRESGEPLADDLAHALRRAEVRRRPGEAQRAVDELDGVGLDERAPELADEERVAPGELADRLRELGRPGARLAARGAPDELGHLLAREAAEPHADDVVAPSQVRERLGERLR